MDEISKTKTSYGVYEVRGNRLIDIFPISFTKQDLGGADGVPGKWFEFLHLNEISLFEKPYHKKMFGACRWRRLAFINMFKKSLTNRGKLLLPLLNITTICVMCFIK